jgi:hypothetical protein
MRICAICLPRRKGFAFSFKLARAFLATSRMSAFYLLGGSFLLRCPAFFGGCGNAGASFGRENPLLLLW